MLTSMSYLDEWNALPADAAADAVLPCCGSRAWATGLAARRPLGTLPELLAASDSAWWSLPEEAWHEAFATHPRIGERHASSSASSTSSQWSAAEQGLILNTIEPSETERLLAGNRAYEEHFGRVFLIRAAGRSTAEILAILDRRLRNTSEAELQESAEQQREITHLRLQRWLTEHEGVTGAPLQP